MTYNETGQVDFSDKLLDFQSTYWNVERDIGERLNAEIGDQKVLNSVQTKDVDLRSAFLTAGYSGEQDPQARTIEWWQMDYEYAQTPVSTSPYICLTKVKLIDNSIKEVSSRDMTMASHVSETIRYAAALIINAQQDSTFGGFSDKSHLSIDPRGFNTFIKGLASEYLAPNDNRLLLNRVVDRVTWNDQNVTIDNTDGTCIEAEYAITTFSLGVLQSSAVTFSPPLPDSKHSAIQRFQMGTYTKIFLQFPPDQVFWNRSVELFLYASPTQRGYYPVFQSLDHDSFLPGSGILFVTVVTDQSYIVESQSDETTKQQVLQVLREMFGTDAVPDPIDFMYPRWSSMPWAYGSFSNWPPGFTIEDHDDLRGNMGRVWFAGEATSRKYYGYLHGAYFEGRDVGQTVADCVLDPLASHCIRTNLDSI